jgi:aminopeptidase N
MNIYLTRHQYKNTFTEDLWRALEEASGKPIGQVMGTWTKQMGFPLIRVQSEQNGDTRVMRLTQEKYWADPNLKRSKEHNAYQWMIPIAFTSSSDPKTAIGETLMEEKMMSVNLPGIRSDEWVKVNLKLNDYLQYLMRVKQDYYFKQFYSLIPVQLGFIELAIHQNYLPNSYQQYKTNNYHLWIE